MEDELGTATSDILSSSKIKCLLTVSSKGMVASAMFPVVI
jgi:hypothetical protein